MACPAFAVFRTDKACNHEKMLLTFCGRNIPHGNIKITVNTRTPFHLVRKNAFFFVMLSFLLIFASRKTEIWKVLYI